MKITCTVEEFGIIVRGCNDTSRLLNCPRCPLYELCEDGFIDQFVSHENIIPDQQEEEQ